MTKFYEKTPQLGEGVGWSVMNFLLTQVKKHRGLTSFIEKNGVNGRWLKPDDLYNIRITKFMKIMEIKARYQNDDEFLEEWNALGEFILNLSRVSHHLKSFL